MKGLILLYLVLGLFVLSGCKQSSGDGFSGLEDSIEESSSSESKELAVEIISVSPDEVQTSLISNEQKNFAVQVNSGAGEVKYSFKLDGSLVQEKNSPFYILEANAISAGEHSLEVRASNSISEDTYTFNLKKNSPPTINLDSHTSQTISCVGDTFTLNITANDVDSDNLTYSFFHNGSNSSSALTTSSGLTSASLVFDPSCSFSGNNNLTIRVTDSNGEFSEYSIAVTVTNPNITTIDSFSPTGNPVVILSNETKNFIISASGNPPLTYSWDINPGSTISSCNNLTNCDISGGDFSPGNYVLKSTVTDSISTSADHSFNITINEKPQVSFQVPSSSNTIKMNCSSSKNFQLTIQDANWSDGQRHTIEWTMDGTSSSALTNTNNIGSYPVTSNATFSPSCDGSLIGDHIIKAVISDGYETQEVTWNLRVNYFSEACNSLDAGEICTIAGLKGMGSGLSTITQNNEIRIRPEFVESNPSGGFFISDGYRHGIWFYNNTNSDLIVLGKSVPANTLLALFGQTNYGLGTDGQSYTNYYLNSPKALAYSQSENALYVADYGNHQIVRFNSNGQGYRWAGKGSSNTDGATRKSHKCNYPIGLALDEVDGKVFVACYGNTGGADGGFKYFLTGLDEGYTLLRYQSNTTIEGSILYSGSGRTPRAYSIAKDPNKKIVYAGDIQKCRIMAISYGDTESYYNGTLSLSANSMVRVSRGSACGEIYNRAWTDTGGRLRPYALEAYSDAGVTKGVFWTQNNRHSVGFLNFTGGDITLGGRTVNAGKFHLVWGLNGVADYSRGEPAYSSTYGNSPMGIKQVGSKLLIADRNNYRLSSLEVNISNGQSEDVVGNLKNGDFDDELPKQANLRYFNRPRGLAYSEADNSIFIYDYGNQRIRKMNLVTGNITTEVGRGATGNSNSNPEDPLDAYFRFVGDLSFTSDGQTLFYSDFHGSNGTNRNCLVRSLNRSSSTQTILNESVPTHKVSTIAGDYVQGCQTWNAGSHEGQLAVNTPLRYPVGVTSQLNGSEIYISDYASHCIYKVNSSGIMNAFIGQCNSSGDLSGQFTSAQLYRPGAMIIDSDTTQSASGSFFIVDRWINSNSYIKYANLSASTVNILGIDIPAGEIAKVISSDGYVGGVATFGDQICYSQGANANGSVYAHNVICVNRSTGLTTLRVGKISASVVKAGSPHYDEEEGVLASSASLSAPWGIAFDKDGNLFISSYTANNIRFVKRWF